MMKLLSSAYTVILIVAYITQHCPTVYLKHGQQQTAKTSYYDCLLSIAFLLTHTCKIATIVELYTVATGCPFETCLSS